MIMCHMLSHNKKSKGLSYGYILTKKFKHFNVNLVNEAYTKMTEKQNQH